MGEREILVADSDSTVRKQMADSFRSAGYDVETTDSAVHVFCTVLEKQIPVVLLGSGFDKKMALADLVRLLKQCNRHLTIILVSDEESLPTMRTVRQEGIFYHALKPTSQEDTAEILSAVDCAFDKSEQRDGMGMHRIEEATIESTATAEPGIIEERTIDPAREVSTGANMINRAQELLYQEDTKMKAKTAAIVTALVAAVAGFVYCVIAATRSVKENGDLVVWGFLGFCALIVVGQLIPAYISMKAARKVMEQKIRENLADEGEKQHAYAVFDKNK
jgi:FixJ family two-component response regulator